MMLLYPLGSKKTFCRAVLLWTGKQSSCLEAQSLAQWGQWESTAVLSVDIILLHCSQFSVLMAPIAQGSSADFVSSAASNFLAVYHSGIGFLFQCLFSACMVDLSLFTDSSILWNNWQGIWQTCILMTCLTHFIRALRIRDYMLVDSTQSKTSRLETQSCQNSKDGADSMHVKIS